ncbi:MAG: IS1634 family transposase [Acholeplasmatales bacterium]|nr:MAG: IS1634 family transposase [Acholeplasmatales bacterium]
MNIHVTKSPTNNKHYVYLTESYRDKDGKPRRRFIERLGILEDMQAKEPNVLDRLKAEAKAMTAQERKEKIVTLSLDLSKKIDPSVHPLNYGYALLEKEYRNLKIDSFMKVHQACRKSRYDLDRILRLLVYSRVVEPSSKQRTHTRKEQFFLGFEDIKLETIYRALDDLNTVKDTLMVHLNQTITEQGMRDASLVFYDVTNYYFESEHMDGFREKGVSKENKKTGLVQMGLFIDQNGIPITYELFPGNTHDLKTMRPILEKIKKQFNFGKLTIVADKGNNSAENLAMIHDYGDDYIISQRIRGRGEKLINLVLDPQGYQVSADGDFKFKLIRQDKTIEREDGSEVTIEENLMCFWSENEMRYQRAKRGILEEKIERFIDNPALLNASNSFGIKKYFKKIKVDKKTGEVLKGKDAYLFNEEKYQRDLALDGYYTIVTNNLDLHPFEIVKNYRQLSKIEESFKVIKSDLEGRPIFVRNQARIKGHFLTCFLALTLLRIMQYKLDYEHPVHQIVEAIRRANCIEISQDIFKMMPSNEVFEKLTNHYDIDFGYNFMRREHIKRQL